MQVGLIGVGKMGGGIAINLIKSGHRLVVHDIQESQLTAAIQAGGIVGNSPKEVAENSDVVLTSLPGPENVKAVCGGKKGLLASLKPGQVYFDLSTNSPTLARKLHSAFQEAGVHFLDAPVSGGPFGAVSGKLAIWVGGQEAVFNQYKTLLLDIGDEVSYVGDIGAGSIAKLVHNCSGFIMYAALAETFSLGIKAGLEPDILWETVRKGLNGRRPMFDSLARNFLPNSYDEVDFALKLATKDCRLATELAKEHNVPMKLACQAYDELQLGMQRGWGERDARAFMLLQLERAGIEPPSVSKSRINNVLAELKN